MTCLVCLKFCPGFSSLIGFTPRAGRGPTEVKDPDENLGEDEGHYSEPSIAQSVNESDVASIANSKSESVVCESKYQ